LRRDTPGWVGVGYPEKGDVEDDEDAAQDEDWYCEEGEAGEDGAFGCLKSFWLVVVLRVGFIG
jgi:hypothetical protein